MNLAICDTLLADVRVAMNVAACDAQRLLVLYAKTKSERKQLERLLLPLAWHAGIMGKLLFASSNDLEELAIITEHSSHSGLLVVEPDTYGLAAKQVAFIRRGTQPEAALMTLLEAAAGNKVRSKDSKSHIRQGQRAGLLWESLVKETESSKR